MADYSLSCEFAFFTSHLSRNSLTRDNHFLFSIISFAVWKEFFFFFAIQSLKAGSKTMETEKCLICENFHSFSSFFRLHIICSQILLNGFFAKFLHLKWKSNPIKRHKNFRQKKIELFFSQIFMQNVTHWNVCSICCVHYKLERVNYKCASVVQPSKTLFCFPVKTVHKVDVKVNYRERRILNRILSLFLSTCKIVI